mgnify:CR=1 FL=1
MVDPLRSGARTALLETPDDPAFMAELSRRSPVIQQGFEYWCSKGWPIRLPGREDIDPMEMWKLLPNVVLLDVLEEPEDFRYRLIGTAVVYHLASDLTGMRMSDIEHQKPPSRIWDSCKRVVVSKSPLLSNIPYVGPHTEFVSGEDIIMPLANETGDINMLIAFVVHIQKPSAGA